MNHLSLFSGIGGADLAASWAGIETVAHSEIDAYCSRVLAKNFLGVPNLGDIHGITKEVFCRATGLNTVDIISGGFPCQPFSIAGKQRGTSDDRYLWPEMLRVIKELGPTWVVGENVAGFIRLGLDRALSDLESAGYETRAYVLPACSVYAPHQRYRVFIVGYYTEHHGLSAAKVTRSTGETVCDLTQRQDSPRKPERAGLRRDSAPVADSERQRKLQQKRCERDVGRRACDSSKDVAYSDSVVCKGQQSRKPGVRPSGKDWWATEPRVGRVAHGVPSRVDRIRALGNAIVPQVIYQIFAGIREAEA